MKKKILIVEDDPDILEALSFIITFRGYNIACSLTGNELFDELQHLPHLILLDRRLSGTDGLEICKHIKTEPATKDIPVIIISAGLVNGIELKNAGANDFLEKPFDIHELFGKIARYIGN